MAIAAVLFDVGGVLVSSPFQAFAHYERQRGLPEGFISLVNSTNPDDNAWARLERNQVDLAGFSALFEEESSALGHRVPGADVLDLLTGELRPAMIEAVRRCGERLKTAMITNNVAPMSGEGPFRDLADLFDVVIESAVEGVRKPEPAIYRLACDRLGIEPSEAVFLDDLGINLKPARAMGMTTIQVTDPDAALAELETAVGFALR